MQQESLFGSFAEPAGDETARRAAWLRAELARHTILYYRDAKPEISDDAFDAMMHELEAIEKARPDLRTPDSPTQRVGGDVLEGFEKVVHMAPMQSLENTYDIDDLDEYDALVRSLTGLDEVDYAVEAKIDGLASCAVYEKGVLVSVATRGDGFMGDDITANARTIRSLPLRIPTNAERVEVRGEIYMPKRGFLALTEAQVTRGEEPFKNPRNAAAGSIKLLDPKQVAARPLDILLYGLGPCIGLEAPPTHAALTALLRDLGFPGQPFAKVCRGMAAARTAIEELGARRHEFPFEMDGAVLKVNDRSLYDALGATAKAPRWARAYKYAPERAETVVEAITVQVGRSGVLTPVAELRTVHLAGSDISRATLHNEEDVHRKDIRIGDRVLVEKAGEVIPAIAKVLVEKRTGAEIVFHMPDACPVCGAPVVRKEGEVAIRCSNFLCPAQLATRLEHFASRDALDIEGIGIRVATALVDQGLVRKPMDLFTLDPTLLAALDLRKPDADVALPLVDEPAATLFDSDLTGADPVPAGDKTKFAERIVRAIRRAPERSLARWLFALGIPGIGASVARDVASVHRNFSELLVSPLLARARRLYELTDLLPTLSPRTAETATRREAVLAELVEIGEGLVRDGLGTKKKGSGPSYSCIIKPEALRAIDAFFASDTGRELVEDMRRLGIDPVGGAADRRTSDKAADSPFAGKTIVLTGSFHDLKRRDLAERLSDLGASVTGSVSRRTDLLVVGENPGADKTSAARELGTTVMDEKTLREVLGLPPAATQLGLF